MVHQGINTRYLSSDDGIIDPTALNKTYDDYKDFYNFTDLSFRASPLYKLILTRCEAGEFDGAKTVIAYGPDNNVTKLVAKQVEDSCKYCI